MKKFVVALVLLLLLCGCDAGKNFPVDPVVQSSQPEESSALKELFLCGERYPLDVPELVLNESFSIEDAVQLPYAENLESLSLSLSAAYMREYGETALDFLAFCPSVKELTLHVNLNFDEFIPLEVLTRNENLHSLYLSGGAADLSILSRCKGLKELTLEGVRVELSDLAGMELDSLYLSGYQDISGLEGMKSLRYLYPEWAETGFASVAGLGITHLNLADSGVTIRPIDIDHVLAIPTLERLDFTDEALPDIARLAELEHLKTLCIWVGVQNAIAPGGETVTAENMVRLEELDTPIPPEQLQNFLQREGSSILLVRRWQ